MHYSVFFTKSGNALANQSRSCTNCDSGHNSSPDVRNRKLWLLITLKSGASSKDTSVNGFCEWMQFSQYFYLRVFNK